MIFIILHSTIHLGGGAELEWTQRFMIYLSSEMKNRILQNKNEQTNTQHTQKKITDKVSDYPPPQTKTNTTSPIHI